MSKASFSARAKAIASQLRKAVRHILFHNGWVKLIAVLISLLLWAGLISQDETLTRDKTWQNVKVNITGADKLRNNSLIVVSDLDELLSGVTLTAAEAVRHRDGQCIQRACGPVQPERDGDTGAAHPDDGKQYIRTGHQHRTVGDHGRG